METVIAERDKMVDWFVLGSGIALSALSLLLIKESGWWLVFALGVGLLLLGAYLRLLPKAAILKGAKELVLRYAFCKKRFSLSQIEYVSVSELGEWHTKRGGAFWLARIYQNDIRKICITAKVDGSLKHFYLFSILHASAVTAMINSLIEQAKK